jgi:hypothetical protein
MILDAQTQLADSLAATTNTTTVSTNAYDCGNVTPKRQIGDGEQLAVVFFIESVSGSADTFTLQAISATNVALTSGVKIVARTRILTAAELTAKKIVVLTIPPGEPDQRYLGGSTILGASDALTYSAYVLPVSFVQKLKDYASAFVIG